MQHITPSHDKEEPSVSTVPPITDVTRQRPKLIVNIVLTSHTLEAIQQVMTATPAPNLYTTPHIAHPTLPLPLTHLHRLHRIIQSAQDQTMPHRVILHHIHITALSALVPSDRTLKLSLDNTIHTLTPPRTGNVATPHHLHLFLNPHNRLMKVLLQFLFFCINFSKT